MWSHDRKLQMIMGDKIPSKIWEWQGDKKVAAKNTVGTGAQSSASNAVTPATVPGAPTAVSATAGDTQAAVSWTAPGSNGGSAIVGYQVTPYVSGVAQAASYVASTATTRDIVGLTNGTTYTFKVVAVNNIGSGKGSNR